MLKKVSYVALMLALAAVAAFAQTPKPQPAQDPHAGHGGHATARPKPPAEPETAAGKWFTDVELIDQDGKTVRFYSDLLKGKTVVVNAFFTTCASVCPPMNRNFEKIQEAFGDRVGKDVFLISISVDPATDTPPRLKEYAKKFNARAGWTFLTGK
ncbi:MAG TPA: SCO family protein [Pyrinomonadaceae bacterium]|nr:SCO family protein [Pyrinomonadaceae bacterium]